MMAIPRIGHEVIVSFLEGDPDQPIVTGRTYHATNVPPYPLSENKTRTVLRTESHQGEGFNELRFEDQSGAEEIYLHAQKDMNLLVQNDRKDHIKYDLHLEVENERFQHIKVDDHLTVDGNANSHVKGDISLSIDGSMHVKQGKKYLLEAGTEIHHKAGDKVIVEAGTEITIKTTSGFLKLDPAGVHASGTVINLNSGGSAGSGSGYGGVIAMLPGGVTSPNGPSEQLLALQAPTMTSLLPLIAEKDIPMMEICQKRGNGQCSKPNCECNNG